MFKLSFLKSLTALALSVGIFLSCSSDSDSAPETEGTIAEIIANSPNLSTLQIALERTGLDATLQNPGSRTVLAPTNAAFDLFLTLANFPSVNDVPVDVLEQLVLNHVLGARVDESLLRSIGKNYTETLADGPGAGSKLALYFDATGSMITFNGNVKVTDADIPADNGVIHIVDTVLDFPTLKTFIEANDAFTELTLALTTATPGTDFMSTLSATGPYTLFAPADAAIDDLLATNASWTTVDDIDEALLTAILQHHVVSGNLRSADISNNESATTLEGDAIQFSTANGQLDITDGSGNMGITVVIADIQAKNGVMHAIDKVLLPDTSN
jgi:uncharacterized surface protein with fasciclin (FAS1) repeats